MTERRDLRRELGLLDAVMMGLGAMIGTGVFVSVGLGAGLVGPAVVLALVLAAGVALCSGLSSAQLAAAHPVSGGSYEYAYLYLNSWAGFTAGWVFLAAKSASAATAALGFAGYALHAFGVSASHRVPLALVATAALTAVVLAGIRRSSLANLVIVSMTLLSLLYFVGAGLPHVQRENLLPFFAAEASGSAGLLEATALMFVAFAGYARIATLGEEVREPQRTIPAAIITSTLSVMLLYAAVAIVGIGVLGSHALLVATEQAAAPLAVVAQRFTLPISEQVLMIGAVTAMLGVLLNLILGLSRVVLAMARRGDVFAVLGRVDRSGSTPYWAVLAVATGIAGLVVIGDIRLTWSFSAFAVLVYYSLTNLAAWRMPPVRRRYPRWIAGLGCISSLSLAFWIERQVFVLGVAFIALGWIWHAIARWGLRRP